MYLSSLKIKGYKVFKDEFKVKFNKGLTILLGENASGKTAIIDAVRLLLNEDEYGRMGISSSDFHRPINKPAKEKGVDSIELRGVFSELDEERQVAYLPWLDAVDSSKAYLNIKIDNKETPRGKYNRVSWGGESIQSIFEWELLDTIACIYLPPLRDAGNKLEAYRGSRLSRLFRNEKPKPGSEHELETEFKIFNDTLSKKKTIEDANKQIKSKLKESLGNYLGQDALIQFSEISFDRIVEKLRLLFYPKIIDTTKPEFFRDISENSMGYNNILYLATVLAELERTKDSLHKILLIEEPEAHLHPQIQIRLLQYLQEQSKKEDIQIIITTHSATVTSSADLDSLNVLTIQNDKNPKSTLIKDCKIDKDSKFFLERWLDITKSTLFFAKGLIFVEGIAEALVIKELSKKVVEEATKDDPNPRKTLEDCGVSIINLNGIYFKHFFKLFQGYKIKDDKSIEKVDFIPIRCSGITDCDPEPVKDTKPIKSHPCVCGNSQSSDFSKELIDNKSEFCRIFSNLKTFEYDLGMENENLKIMIEIFNEWLDTNGPTKSTLEEWLKKEINTDDERKDVSFELLHFIESIQNKAKQIMGKGLFSQKLAYKLSENPVLEFSVPEYIKDAILWAINKTK
jgi:putative ATP-dependent endonuclease of the OLD family